MFDRAANAEQRRHVAKALAADTLLKRHVNLVRRLNDLVEVQRKRGGVVIRFKGEKGWREPDADTQRILAAALRVKKSEIAHALNDIGITNAHKLLHDRRFVIARFVAVHGTRYDYTRSDYRGAKIPVIIACKEHGEFKQRPDHHLRGAGCPVCAGKKSVSAATWVKRWKKAHGDRYDYSRADVLSVKQKVEIICREHGSFFMQPHNHKNGQGCPQCAGRKPEQEHADG